ncbi:hypothetical protein ACFQVA_28890 [Actinomadura keratinilytica]
MQLAPGHPVRRPRPGSAAAAISDESLDLRWFSYDEVAGVADASVVRLLDAARERLGAPS